MTSTTGARLRLAGVAVALLMALVAAGSAQSRALTVVLTGQTTLQSDFRVLTPAIVPAMAPLMKGDVVFTNFETTVAMKGEPNERTPGAGSGFHTPPEGLDALMALGINLIATSNNQAWGLGPVGILNTIREAKKRNLTFAGSGATLQEAAAPAYIRTANGTVALVAMASGLVPDGAAATESRPGVNELRLEAQGTICTADAPCNGGAPNQADARRVLQSIGDAAARADLVIVYQHNHLFPSSYLDMFKERSPQRQVQPDWIRQWAHRVVEAGADVVVLHGAPVLMGVEIYRGRPIFYSQGNFIFQVPERVSNIYNDEIAWQSVVSRIEFQGKKKLRSITFQPHVVNKEGRQGDLFIQTRGLPMPVSGEKARAILNQLAELSRPFGTAIEIHVDTAELRLP